ncbi:SPW repeat protein [Patescibacteria group bacterium]|nr:SPW repeat protein [Patescibacteria group bacterium]
MPTTMHLPQARMQVRTASGLDVVAGLWLIAAPFIFNYSVNGGSTTNDIIVGIVVLVLAATQAAGENYRMSWPSWVNVLLGIWLIIAPFALSYPSGSAAMWNDIVLGIVVGILALVSALSVPSETIES